MAYDNEFLNLFSQSEEDQRLQMLAEAEAKVAANTAQMKSIPTRIQAVLKDPKTKQTQIVDQDVPQEVRKLAAKEQRGKMIENAGLTANIQRAKEIPPNYDRTDVALYKLGVADGDIARLKTLAEQGDVQNIVGELGRVGQAIFEGRGLGDPKSALLPEQMITAQQQIREELFGALGSVFQRAQDQARNMGKPASPLSNFATPSSTVGQPLQDTVAKGGRSFTNIGTEDGQIQEVKPDSGLIRVTRKADGVPGYISQAQFDPARYSQLETEDFSHAEARSLPGFANQPIAAPVAMPQPSMTGPPVPSNVVAMNNIAQQDQDRWNRFRGLFSGVGMPQLGGPLSSNLGGMPGPNPYGF